jgi:hypothetical protein
MLQYKKRIAVDPSDKKPTGLTFCAHLPFSFGCWEEERGNSKIIEINGEIPRCFPLNQ